MSKESIDIRLARQLAKKLKLENRFKPELTRFFKQIGRDSAAIWLATGGIPTLESLKDGFKMELIALLRAHYRRVAKVFSVDSRNEMKHVQLTLETKQEESIDLDVIRYINNHSIQQSTFILRTTRKDLTNTVATVVSSSALAGESLTQAQIAKRIQVEFDQRSINRVDTIAMTETQTSAEEIKLIESFAVANTLREVTGQTMVKTWATVLDERTRASHVAADRQEQPLKTPYIVQGERLPVPGSAVLGASLNNIINCRCSSINTIKGEPAGFNPREGALISDEALILQ